MSAEVKPKAARSLEHRAGHLGSASSVADPALAELEARIAGAMIDGLFLAAPQVALAFAVEGTGALENMAAFDMRVWWAARGALIVVYYTLQAYLIVTTGQSIGKRLVGTRIVRTDGRPVGFVRGVLLRNGVWALLLWSYAPVGLSIANILAMPLTKRRQALHDKLADTVVVRATT